MTKPASPRDKEIQNGLDKIAALEAELANAVRNFKAAILTSKDSKLYVSAESLEVADAYALRTISDASTGLRSYTVQHNPG